MITYIHWAQQRFQHLPPKSGVWLGADELGTAAFDEVLQACYADPAFRYILFIWPTQSRLLNEDNDWVVSMSNAVRALHAYGIAGQCGGVQYGDEWWSGLYTGSLNTSPYWPALHGMTPQQSWAARFTAAQLWADRTAEFRRLWTAQTLLPCPPIGMAETAGCAPPQFPGQDFWAFNVYAGEPGFYLSTAEVRRLYDLIWSATRLPVQVVVPMFGEGRYQVPPVAVLAQTYWPILQHSQVWSAGVFCLHHPSTYDSRHGSGGRGILQLDGSYLSALQVLCEEMGKREWSWSLDRPSAFLVNEPALLPLKHPRKVLQALQRHRRPRFLPPAGLPISSARRLVA